MFATTVPTCAGHFRIAIAPVFRVETKNTVYDIPYAQWSPILAIYNDLRMRTTFSSVTGSQIPMLLSITYSSKSESTRHYAGIDLSGHLRQVPHERTA